MCVQLQLFVFMHFGHMLSTISLVSVVQRGEHDGAAGGAPRFSSLPCF